MSKNPPSFGGLVLTTSLAFVIVQLDVTIVNVALPSIARGIHVDTSGLQWVVDSYTLTLAVFMLSAGALGDRFGARFAFQAGLAVFGVASLACALAANGTMLNISRGVQGLGAAAMLPNSLALLNHEFASNPARRAKAVGWWTAAGSISVAAGPVIGGLLLGAVGWRAIFFVNIPLCLLALYLGMRLDETPRASKKRGLDGWGQLCATIALSTFTASIIEFHALGWHSLLFWSGVATSITFGIAFILIEKRVVDPMVPLALFRVAPFSAAVVLGMIVNLTYYGTIFALSFYLQQVLGYSAMNAGFAFLPLTAGFFLSNVASGRIVAAVGPRIPMVAGLAIDTLGFLLLLRAGVTSSYAELVLPFLLIPVGMGLAVPAMTTSVLASVDKGQSGIASAVLNTARQAAGAVGVAIFGALAAGNGAAVVGGLHVSATISAVLLTCGVVLAWTVGAAQKRKARS